MNIMKLLEYILTELLKQGLKRIIIHTEFMHICDNVNFEGFSVTKICDERSMGYVAVGMYEESEQPIAIIVDESKLRNLSPAITEAYYRKIPLIIIFIEDRHLNNIQYPKDMFKMIYNVSAEGIQRCLNIVQQVVVMSNQNGGTPILLGVKNYNQDISLSLYKGKSEMMPYMLPKTCNYIDKVTQILNCFDASNVCFFIDSKLMCDVLLQYKIEGCIEYNKGLLSQEGLLSIMVGSSIVAPNKRFVYIGMASSAMYDINSLGNRHIAENICVCLLRDKKNYLDTIKLTCATWNYDVYSVPTEHLQILTDKYINDKVANPSIIEIL